jgi:predicted XRE-type DNA-binding protein
MATTHRSVEHGSGNVFADLGFLEPDLERARAALTLQVYRTIKRRKLTQAQTGDALGIKPASAARLMRGSSGRYSVDRLMQFLATLGHDIEIVIRPSRKRRGEISVRVPAAT